jgi:hypothetical protein
MSLTVPHLNVELTQPSASFPDDAVHSLSTNEHINVENDGEVKTQ